MRTWKRVLSAVVSGDEPAKLKPGDFAVCLSRRFPPDESPGYEETITVHTLLRTRPRTA
jgi:hypothetical protein